MSLGAAIGTLLLGKRLAPITGEHPSQVSTYHRWAPSCNGLLSVDTLGLGVVMRCVLPHLSVSRHERICKSLPCIHAAMRETECTN